MSKIEKGTYTNGDILGSSKEPVDQDAHEGGIQSILHWQFSQLRVGHTLRNDDGADGDTSDHVTK